MVRSPDAGGEPAAYLKAYGRSYDDLIKAWLSEVTAPRRNGASAGPPRASLSASRAGSPPRFDA